MKVIGLCGGIGAGKSTVATLLAERGAMVIDVDTLGRHVLTLREVRDAVAAEFGNSVLRPDGTVDRGALAEVVFSSKGRLADLEAISHPAINREILRRLDALAENPPDLVVLDMAVLVESNLGQLANGRGYTEVVVVEADSELRMDRLAERGMAPDDARSRIATQATDAERRAVADYILVNNRDREHLAVLVDDLLARLMV